MNYQRPELLEHLAASYVVGTLRGAARARFERLCVQMPDARAALRRWEDRLMPMLPPLTPVTPSDRVWTQIAQRIQIQSPPTKNRVAFWRWALAGGLALSLVVGISVRLLNPPQQVVAALGQDAAHPIWHVSRNKDSSALTLLALASVQANPQSAYELWALPRNGKAPISLGLMPREGSTVRVLTAIQRSALLGANKIAVSLEPPGGSTTGTPTGPVLYVAEITITG